MKEPPNLKLQLVGCSQLDFPLRQSFVAAETLKYSLCYTITDRIQTQICSQYSNTKEIYDFTFCDILVAFFSICVVSMSIFFLSSTLATDTIFNKYYEGNTNNKKCIQDLHLDLSIEFEQYFSPA